MRIYIIFWMSSTVSQFGPPTEELAALEHLKSPHRFIMALRRAIVALLATCLKEPCYLSNYGDSYLKHIENVTFLPYSVTQS